MIKMNYIQEYVTLVETLNFSKTAELLYITQPALSRHIASIEVEMGGKLLERTTRNVVVTPAGEAVYECFQNILHQYSLAKERTAFLSSDKTGTLRFSVPHYWTEHFAEPLIEKFLDENPECSIDLDPCVPKEGLNDVLEGRSDVLISTAFSKIDENICRIPFLPGRLAVVCLKDDPIAEYDEIHLADVDASTIVSLNFENSSFEDFNVFISALLAKRNIFPKKFFFAQQVDTLCLTLKRNGGISIIPYGSEHMARSYCKIIPLLDDDCVIPIYIYYRADNNSPLIPKLMRCAKEIRDDV
jgi:DNA-binding transcriptional LysR family regulator